MQTITMDKETLIGILKANRENHIREFQETYNNWLIKYRAMLKAELENPNPTGSVRLAKPESHEKDYDITLSMLTHETSNSVKIERYQYEEYVLDDWSWKKSFELCKTTYNNNI